MRQVKPLMLSLAIAVVGCSAGNPIQRKVDLATHVAQEQRPEIGTFTYEVKAAYALKSDDGFDRYTVEGHEMQVARDQLVVELKDAKDLPLILRELNGKVISQEYIPEKPTVTGSKQDGTYRQVHSGNKTFIPCYTIDVATDSNAQLVDFDKFAAKADHRGAHKFGSQKTAHLLYKLLKLKSTHADKLTTATLNSSSAPLAATTEGATLGSSLNNVAPTDNALKWTGPTSLNANNLIRSGSGNLNSVEYGNGGDLVDVAVIDHGFQGAGESYMPVAIVNGSEVEWDFENGDNNIQGAETAGGVWHGRKVASLIFAGVNDSRGTVGSAPAAEPILLHVNLGNGDQRKSAVDTAISWGADVINYSYGHYFANPNNEDPATGSYLNANSQNIIQVAGAGNNGDQYLYPAYHWWILSVGAHGANGNKATFSNGGVSNTWNVDIYASGNNVYAATVPNSSTSSATHADTYKVNFFEGTSAAAPIVAGTCAIAKNRGYASSTSTASSLVYNYGYTSSYGFRLLDAWNVVW